MSKHVLTALSSALFTLAWWKAAALRGARTAVVIVIPYVGTVLLFKDVDWLTIVSAAGLGFVASLITSLAGISEADGKKVSIWVALVERTVKTVAQGLVVGIGNAVLFTDVSWPSIVQASLIAGLGSLLIGVLGYLPEASNVSAGAATVGYGKVTLPGAGESVTVSYVSPYTNPASPNDHVASRDAS